ALRRGSKRGEAVGYKAATADRGGGSGARLRSDALPRRWSEGRRPPVAARTPGRDHRPSRRVRGTRMQDGRLLGAPRMERLCAVGVRREMSDDYAPYT